MGENLQNLKDVQLRVRKSHNLVVLLTSKVLTRPWVLVEIVTAFRTGLRVVPVKVTKPGASFDIPSENFYTHLCEMLTAEGIQVLSDAGVSIGEVQHYLREMFNEIVISYSPHQNRDIRQLELKTLLKRCKLSPDAEFTPKSSE